MLHGKSVSGGLMKQISSSWTAPESAVLLAGEHGGTYRMLYDIRYSGIRHGLKFVNMAGATDRR